VSYEYFWDTQTKTWDNVSITYLNSSYAHTAEFNMQSGTPSDHLDFWSTNTDTWDSLSSQQEAWGYVPSIGVSRTANLDLSSNINVPTVGFLLDGTAILAMESEIPSAANTIYINGVTFSSTQGDSSVGNLTTVNAVTLGTTVNFPLAGTTTWDLETETWTTTTGSWGYAPPVTISVNANINQVMLNSLNAEDITMMPVAILGMTGGVSADASVAIPTTATLSLSADVSDTGIALMPMSITMASDNTFTDTANTLYPSSITISSNGGFSLAEDMLIPVDVTLGISNDINGTNNAIYVDSVTLANEQGIKFNINFEESASFDINSGISSINNFLWNDEAEDTGTTWTKVSDPDE
jgi:hypothetical protein